MASFSGDHKTHIGLNIMPMLDIFSILILFLLMNYSTDPVNYDLNKNVELPISQTTASLDDIPSLILAKNQILINDHEVAPINNGAVAESLLRQGAIYPLYVELKKISDLQKSLSNTVSHPPASLTIEVDKTIPFKLIKQAMLAAQQAEFVDFKLMVAKTKQ